MKDSEFFNVFKLLSSLTSHSLTTATFVFGGHAQQQQRTWYARFSRPSSPAPSTFPATPNRIGRPVPTARAASPESGHLVRTHTLRSGKQITTQRHREGRSTVAAMSAAFAQTAPLLRGAGIGQRCVQRPKLCAGSGHAAGVTSFGGERRPKA